MESLKLEDYFQDYLDRNIKIDIADYNLKKYLKEMNGTSNDGLLKSYMLSDKKRIELQKIYDQEFKILQSKNSKLGNKFKGISYIDRQTTLRRYQQYFNSVKDSQPQPLVKGSAEQKAESGVAIPELVGEVLEMQPVRHEYFGLKKIDTLRYNVGGEIQIKEIYEGNGCTLQLLYSEANKSLFQIVGLYVEESKRRNKIGSKCIDFAKERAKELGFDNIIYLLADYEGKEYSDLVRFVKLNGFEFVGNSNKKMIFKMDKKEPKFGFMESSPMQQARALKSLQKRINTNGVIIPIYEWIEGFEKGLNVETTKIHSSKSEKGYVEKPTVGNHIVFSKTEQDYYIYLENNGESYTEYLLKKKVYNNIVAEQKKAEKEIKDKEKELLYNKNLILQKESKDNQIKEYIENGMDDTLKKFTFHFTKNITELKNKNQTKSILEDIDYNERMIAQTKRQVENSYKIAINLYEVVGSIVVPKYDWKIGDSVLIEGYVGEDRKLGKIQTKIESFKENLSRSITYKVEAKEGIINNYVGYDSIYPIEQEIPKTSGFEGEGEQTGLKQIEKMEIEEPKKSLIYSPRSIDELTESLEILEKEGYNESVYHDIQSNYFNDYVVDDPTKLGEFLVAIKGLKSKNRFDLSLELEMGLGSSKYKIDEFSKSIQEKGINIYNLLPESLKSKTKVKRIDFTPSPDSEGLGKITDLFVGTDDLRPVMRGVFFDKENSHITVTDAHRMLLINEVPDVEKSSICLMGKHKNKEVKDMTKVLGEDDAKKWALKMVNKDGCWEVDGNYPRYLQVIPVEFPQVFDFDAETLMNYAKTVTENFANKITHQIRLVFEADGEKVEIGVNGYFLFEALKGLLMLGHDRIDFCYSGAPNKAMVLVPKGNSRKVSYNKINTDLVLLMPVMIRGGYTDYRDVNVVYDLSDSTIKTYDEFQNGKKSVVLEPIIEPQIETEIVPIEAPIEEPIIETVIEPVVSESSEMKDAIEGLKILKGLTKSRKEKKEIQDAIDGVEFLLGDESTGTHNEIRTLVISHENPLSSQLFRITGDHYGTHAFKNVDNDKLNAGLGNVFQHIESGALFTAINESEKKEIDFGLEFKEGGDGQIYADYKLATIYKYNDGTYAVKVDYGTNPKGFKNLEDAIEYADYRTAEKASIQLGEELGDETNAKRKKILKEKIKEADDIVNRYEHKSEKGGKISEDSITTYKIEKIPNESYYGIYATNKEFEDGWGSTSMLVSSFHKTMESAKKKMKQLKEQDKLDANG